jgi:hypothetical protein
MEYEAQEGTTAVTTRTLQSKERNKKMSCIGSWNCKDNYKYSECWSTCGACGSVLGWSTMLQAGRSRVRFHMRPLHFSIDLILPPAQWPGVDSASLVREGAPQKQGRNCQTVINIWSWAPNGARHQDLLTDWLTVSRNDFDSDLWVRQLEDSSARYLQWETRKPARAWSLKHGSWVIYGVRIRHQATTGKDTANWENLVHAVVNCRVCEITIDL